MKNELDRVIAEWSKDNGVELSSIMKNSLLDRMSDVFVELLSKERGVTGHRMESLPLSWDQYFQDKLDDARREGAAPAGIDLPNRVERMRIQHGWIYLVNNAPVFVPEFVELQPAVELEEGDL